VREISVIEEVTTQYKGSSFPSSSLFLFYCIYFQVLYFLAFAFYHVFLLVLLFYG